MPPLGKGVGEADRHGRLDDDSFMRVAVAGFDACTANDFRFHRARTLGMIATKPHVKTYAIARQLADVGDVNRAAARPGVGFGTQSFDTPIGQGDHFAPADAMSIVAGLWW